MLKVNGYKMLHIFGSTDGACSLTGIRRYLKWLGWKKTEQWTPWIIDDQLIGYKTGYGEYKLVTMNGLGHTAMFIRGKETMDLVFDFIKV